MLCEYSLVLNAISLEIILDALIIIIIIIMMIAIIAVLKIQLILSHKDDVNIFLIQHY